MVSRPRIELLLTAPPVKKQVTTEVVTRFLAHWWLAFAGSSIFVVSGHLLIKAGLNIPPTSAANMATRLLHAIVQPQVLGGLVVYLMGTLCWMRTVSQKEISFIYPLTSLNYVLVVAASTVFFQEVVSSRRTAGVLLIVLGMVLMTRQRSKEKVCTQS
jgi:uncharacterized membrane protein